MTSPEIKILDSLENVPLAEWNVLAGDDPFLRHEFFSALHENRCVSKEKGWLPQFLTLWDDSGLCGAMPMYLKSHSYGEYVFDWAWADAYRHYGYSYYPKLVSAVPFSPITGRRLMAPTAQHRALLCSTALEMAHDKGVSSLHCLFPCEDQACEMQNIGMVLRHGLQFHWKNRHPEGYENFEAFLRELSHAKRKRIRQERRKIEEAGIHFQWLTGYDATGDHWRFFMDCYNKTYRDHHSNPYLNLEFFMQLGNTMPENIVLIMALRGAQPLAASLSFFNSRTLYGRYWGAQEFIPGLHFETCYYQPIEFCIAHCIQLFEGGAQGAHKLARGFLPVRTWSAHWLAHPEFFAAVGDYLEREARDISYYLDELNESSPFQEITPGRMKFCSNCATQVELRVPEGDTLPRYVCAGCGVVHYQNPKIVVGCIPEWEDSILLCCRAIEPRHGLWTVPSGFMENTETLAQGAARETLEEANARVELGALYAIYNLPCISQVHILFRATLLDLDFKPGFESLDVRLFAEADIPWERLAFRVIREPLRRYFEERRQGKLGFHMGTIEQARY